jgi:hypothetical protein
MQPPPDPDTQLQRPADHRTEKGPEISTALSPGSFIQQRREEMSPQKKYRILIIDDHPIFCLGMSELINKEPDLEVCGSIEAMKQA